MCTVFARKERLAAYGVHGGAEVIATGHKSIVGQFRYQPTLTVHNGKLYALGGAVPICRRRQSKDDNYNDRIATTDAIEMCYANHSHIHNTVEV